MNSKPRVFLIKCKGYESAALPYGILYIQSFLRKHGLTVQILDRDIDESFSHLKKIISAFNPDIIGLSAMTVQAEDARHTIRNLRSYLSPEKIIITGGVHFTAKPNDGLKFGADYVIRGEGEQSMLEFSDSSFDKNVIDGKTLAILDDIPALSLDDLRPFIKEPSFYRPKGFHIITARGCPYRCNFCLGEEQRPKGIRYHSIDYVINFMNSLIEHFGIDHFFIVDDVFVINKVRVLEFCDAVQSKLKNPIKLHCFTHAGHGDLALYKEMKKAGFHRISMGVEHGNDRILELMGKRTTRAQIEETCAQIHEAGLKLGLTYILGNITETNKTITETVNFAIDLHNKYNSSSWFSFMQPLPGSPVYREAEQHGKYVSNRKVIRNTELTYLPFEVSSEHILNERKRGMAFAN